MKKINGFIPLLLLLVFASCKKVDIAFGTEFIDTDNSQIIKVDSFGVDLSTVLLDSFATSALGSGLVGSYTDPLFGSVTSKNYFDVIPAAYADQYQNTSFDSIQIIGKINKNYYGDTTKQIALNVFRLQEAIVPPNAGSILYNVDNFLTYPTPIGTRNVVIRPNNTDTFAVRLDDVFGKEILGMLQRKSDTVKNSTMFLDYCKGFCISTTTTNAMVFGFKDSIILRLNYKKAGLYLENKNVEFTISNSQHSFNNITANRTGTALQALNPLVKEISSLQPGFNNMAFSQPISSILAKLRFPTAKEILKLPSYKKLLKAQLIIRPVQNTYTTPYLLPPQLRLARTTQLNQIGTDLTAIGSSGAAEVQYGNLVIDYIYGKDTYYNYDVTSYLGEVIATDGYTQNGLLLLPAAPDYQTKFNRVAIGNRNNSLGKVELQIFYVAVQ